MAEQKKTPAIPQRSLAYLLVCGVGVVAFVLTAHLPAHRALLGLDEEIASVKAKIEEQKTLYPAYKEALANLQKEKEAVRAPERRSGLTQDQVGRVSHSLGLLAQTCGMKPGSITPDVKSLTGGSGSVSVVMVLVGDLSSIHRFLMEIQKLPYLNHIEEIQVREAAGGKELKMKIWLLTEKQKSGNG